MKLFNLCNVASKFINYSRCHLHYSQGQKTPTGIREYFYYIDHRGQLFLDDARIKNFTSCFKEKQFLKFFFTRLKINNTGRYEKKFPFISPCGPELNFISCDDLPVVFDKIQESQDTTLSIGVSSNDQKLIYGGGQMFVKFMPSELLVDPQTGRVYHPAPIKLGGVGLVGSILAQQLSENFIFGDEHNINQEAPTHINWEGSKIKLTNNYNILRGVAELQGPKSNPL